MKISGRNIKRRLYGLRKLPSNLKRARYFRGHGVHSPFVYAVVRQVFMRSRLFPEGATGLYYELLARGISQRRAVQLQNLRRRDSKIWRRVPQSMALRSA